MNEEKMTPSILQGKKQGEQNRQAPFNPPHLPNGANVTDSEKENTGNKGPKQSTNSKDVGTQEIQMLPMNKTKEDADGNHIESFEPLSNFFQRELLESTTILNESTRQLHALNKSLLKEPESEFQKIDMWNAQEARNNMNTIAKLIQTKVNFVKALKK
jgi:hypothetical protein